MSESDQKDVDALLTSLELEEIDLNLYRGHATYWERRRLFGGLVAAQALAAAYRTVEELEVHSLHSYFLRPGDPSIPVIYGVDRIRDGRSFTTRRVVARQRGEAIFNLAASFHKVEEGFDHQRPRADEKAPEEFPRPEDFGLTQRDYFFWPSEGIPLEIRHEIGPTDWEPGGLHRRMYFRINGDLPDDQAIQRQMLTYLSDLTLLGTAVRVHAADFSGLMMASLDHAIWFHRAVTANDWLLYETHSPSASGARGFNIGHIYTEAGVLVASTAQEGLMRPRTDQ